MQFIAWRESHSLPNGLQYSALGWMQFSAWHGRGGTPPQGGGAGGCSPAIYVNKVLEKGV